MEPLNDPAATNRKRPYSRSAHRARSHASAHLDEPPASDDSHLPDHPLIARGAADMVSSDSELDSLLEHLRSAGSFAYDTEFIGELTYFPKLCLIQTASAQRVVLIDPLAKIDLRPFWELLCDPSVEKIVHAGQQDIEPVIRHLGRAPANVFDTQIAAGFVALPYPASLSKLVMELAGVKLGKGLTFTHWDQRPLSEVQLRYAADDVRYLPLMRAELRRRLEEKGHAEWAASECAAQCNTSLYRFDPESQYLRVRGAGALQPRNLAVLRELTVWRDVSARAHDVPPRVFLRDEILIDLARTPVKSVEKLARVRGLPRPVEAAHGAQIVQTTLHALDLPVDSLPSPREIEPSPADKFRADALWASAQCLAYGRGIDPSLLTNRQEIGEFYRLLQGGGDPTDSPLMQGWRSEALGEKLSQLLKGESKFTLEWSENLLRTRS